ncbi:hypothetical protein Vi05172_g12433 [Venturia inaequalis]|nr:hypothetical protein Vi05172_g12433 [Venturia inaequalis]
MMKFITALSALLAFVATAIAVPQPIDAPIACGPPGGPKCYRGSGQPCPC